MKKETFCSKKINKKYTILALLSMIYTVFIHTNTAIAQPPPCDTCDYVHDMIRMQELDVVHGLPDIT